MVRPEIDGQEGEALTQNISLIDVSADSLARYCEIIEPGQMSSAPVVTQPLSDAAHSPTRPRRSTFFGDRCVRPTLFRSQRAYFRPDNLGYNPSISER